MLSLFVAILVVVGCGKNYDDPTTFDDPKVLEKILSDCAEFGKLQERGDDELLYEPNNDKPYTGWAKSEKDGRLLSLGQISDGRISGVFVSWYENGQRRKFARTKNKTWLSVQVWKPNGEVCPETNLNNGNGVVVNYRDDGNLSIRNEYKNSKLHGNTIIYDEDYNTPVLIQEYRDGEFDGNVDLYDPKTGKLAMRSFYKKGEKDGLQYHFEADGTTVRSVERYKDGVKVE